MQRVAALVPAVVSLVLSSFTCQFGVFAAERLQARRTGGLFNLRRWGVVEWMYLTFAMGAVFVTGQVFEYGQLVSEHVAFTGTAFTVGGKVSPMQGLMVRASYATGVTPPALDELSDRVDVVRVCQIGSVPAQWRFHPPTVCFSMFDCLVLGSTSVSCGSRVVVREQAGK